MDPALLCKVFFTIGIAVGLGGTLIPSFRQQVMNYGSRRSYISPRSEAEAPQNQSAKLFNFVASLQVPHTWFMHYYLISVASSIFWAVQIFTQGRAFRYLASQSHPPVSGMTINQVVLAWCFMTLQGMRRLYECIKLTKSSQSKMWVGLWLLGIAYYIFMGISVWIEGISE
jgi:3-oxo-5-alpha-steroid 4-dehydrogenase 3